MAGGAAGAPAGVGQVRGGRVGPDMHAAVVDEERQRGGIAVAQMPCGLGFGGVLEPHHLDQAAGAVFAANVAQHAAGGDRGQLLVVADEPNAGAAGHGVADDGVQFQGAGLAASSTMSSVLGPMLSNQPRAGSPSWSGLWCSHWYLSMVSVAATISLRSTSAAAALGHEPDTVPPVSSHARGKIAIAVVLPVPAGATPVRRRAPQLAISRDHSFLAGVESGPAAWVASTFSTSSVRRGARRGGGRRPDAPLRGQHVGAGELSVSVGAGHAPPRRGGAVRPVRPGRRRGPGRWRRVRLGQRRVGGRSATQGSPARPVPRTGVSLRRRRGVAARRRGFPTRWR